MKIARQILGHEKNVSMTCIITSVTVEKRKTGSLTFQAWTWDNTRLLKPDRLRFFLAVRLSWMSGYALGGVRALS